MIIRDPRLILPYNPDSYRIHLNLSPHLKHNLPIDYKVTNENGSKAMSGMLCRAKVILQSTDFTALYDKGYHTGSEIKTAIDFGIEVMVAIPEVASGAPDVNYNVANFIYNQLNDTYTCPQGNTLNTNGSWYKKNRGKSFTSAALVQ